MNEKCLIDPERDCFGLIEAHRLEKDLNRHKSATEESLRRHGERLGVLETRMAVNEEKYANILNKLDELIAKVDVMEQKPGKRWETVVEKVILLVVAGAVGYFLTQIGI